MIARFEVLKSLLLSNRSIRRFNQLKPVAPDVLRMLVGLTRYCASGRNAQPLRYRLVTDPDESRAVFPYLAWAGYYTDWAGPSEGERPVAYLVQCLDTELGSNCLCDDGLQLEAITLGAIALDLGACIIKAFNVKAVADALQIPERYTPRYVLALGYPNEQARIVEMQGSDFKYYRDAAGIQCVPKRSLDQLIIE